MAPPCSDRTRRGFCSARIDWLIDHVFLLVPAQDYVGQFLTTFKEYPQRQKAASFNLEEVLEKLKEPHSK